MDELTPNDKTLSVYDLRADDYIAKTPEKYRTNHIPLLRWLDYSASLIPNHGSILEIGSGSGREVGYLLHKGYYVTASDAVGGFVDYLKECGYNTLFLNILKDPIEKQYNMILANAVLPHFTEDDVRLTLKKVHDALLPNGIFAFSLKQGTGDKWVNEKFVEQRYIHFWSVEAIKKLVQDEGYEIVFFEDNIPGDITAHTWINVSIKKI